MIPISNITRFSILKHFSNLIVILFTSFAILSKLEARSFNSLLNSLERGASLNLIVLMIGGLCELNILHEKYFAIERAASISLQLSPITSILVIMSFDISLPISTNVFSFQTSYFSKLFLTRIHFLKFASCRNNRNIFFICQY